ncbi:MAG: UvrB/UvrC motif-containing protein [Planctomycetota bacterium]|jgi:protein arginine kinase activator
MKLSCDLCGKDATIHLTDVVDGQKIEKHLCQECAASEGFTIKAHIPLGKLLEGLMAHSSAQKELEDLRCGVCGITFAEFREHHLLGCPNDYEAFEHVLAPLLERAHDGGAYHTGKVPVNAAESERRHTELLRLRGQLKQSIASEDYESAAELRDRIKELEES